MERVDRNSPPAATEREIRNRKVAKEAAVEGIVLLKNKHTLPLKRGERIALYGAGARKTQKGGTGSGDVNERESVTIEQGLRNAGYEIATERWLNDYDERYEKSRLCWKEKIESVSDGTMAGFVQAYLKTPYQMAPGRLITESDVRESNTDIAIYVIARISGEGRDRQAEKGDYFLFEEEIYNLKFLAKQYKRIVLILNAGGYLDLEEIERMPEIGSILFISQLGMEGGNAVAAVISGEVSPSGKLTDTWARKYEDYPGSDLWSDRHRNAEKEFYREGIFVGYRYFDSFHIPVRYPFGYGLSYTSFQIRVEEVSLCQDEIQVTAMVKNSGTEFSGKEVVQLYAAFLQGERPREYKRFLGFQKTGLLKPGEEERITISCPVSYLESYVEESASWVIEEGTYQLLLGNSGADGKPVGKLRVEQPLTIERVSAVCPLQEELQEIRPDSGDAYADARLEEMFLSGCGPRYSDQSENDTAPLAEGMKLEEMLWLICGNAGTGSKSDLGDDGGVVPGAAGETTGRLWKKYGIPAVVLADGPAGLRLCQQYQIKESGEIYSQDIMASLERGLFAENKWLPDAAFCYQFCTAIPVAHALAQTFNPELVERVGRAVSEEMEEFGVNLWLAPGMNIHRNPLGGRNFEYYSEDPVLTGKIASAMIRGVQSRKGCGAVVKHFACNNREDNRKFLDSIVSERALREIYLKGFQIAITEAKPAGVMSAYNLVNGIHAANNYDLCTKILREEWHYDGIVMTDWNSTTTGGADAALCVRAGNDLIMPGAEEDLIRLKEAVREGTVSEKEVAICAGRLIGCIRRLKG